MLKKKPPKAFYEGLRVQLQIFYTTHVYNMFITKWEYILFVLNCKQKQMTNGFTH